MKKRKKSRIKFTILTVVMLVFISISLILNGIVYPVITDYASAKVKAMTITAVNRAIFNVLNDDLVYSDLITVKTDNNGKINFLEANTLKINNIAKNTAKESKAELDKIGEQTLKIPIGSLTQSPLLTGYGYPVSVKIMSTGSVFCNFKSIFDDAGINQTRHKIYIEVNANMEIVLPGNKRKVDCTIEIFIAESIIVGNIPNIYLNFGNSSNIDFLPK